MDFTRRIELDAPYDDAITNVKDALKEQGFGVLTEIDVRQTLKDKLEIDVEPQIIFGACNPQLAHRALEVDARVATLLPCNVVVRTDGGRTVVEALDPKIMAEVPDNPVNGEGEASLRRLPGALPWVVDATDASFDDAVAATVPVLVDLWAPWCGPCRMVSPLLDDLARQRPGS